MNPLLSRVAADVLGLDAQAEIVDLAGNRRLVRRTYLDSAATCLMPAFVERTTLEYLRTSQANSHTHANPSGRGTTAALAKAHRAVGALVGYDPSVDCVVLLGTGATEPSNLLAAALAADRRDRPLVAISITEHHSNMLPWRRAFGEENVRYFDARADGTVDLESLADLLRREGSRIRIVAVTALSNVTGAITPVSDIASMVHAVGAELAVDGAQAAAHVPIDMHPGGDGGIDYLVLSGHKLYAPGSPGVLVGNRRLFEKGGWALGLVGGGTVDRVDLQQVQFHTDPSERFEAGTPNIPGAIGLGASALVLRTIGMDAVRAHEEDLVKLALEELQAVPGLVLFGPTDPSIRAGVMTFNVGDLQHSLVAAALSDFFAICVRNDCFCAQPLVRQQLDAACEERGYCPAPVVPGKRGMVRASFGLYTRPDDIRLLAGALRWISENHDRLEPLYEHDAEGEFHHKTFTARDPFDLEQATARCLVP